ncbi:MAG: DegT/DnrJ/EryC1/StrS family aminotransferase [Chthoniobacterales bacterium]
MKIPFVDLHAQYLSIKQEIDDAIAGVIRDTAFIRGPHVDRFAKEFGAAVGAQHCVSCANGTDAIYIAMKGLGVKPGDEVITTAHSWISTSETITQAGARVVFCDTDKETFTIDPAQIEAKITPRTVGIIPVHLYGQPADMGAIMEIAGRRNLWVIEDCAQAHFAEYGGRQVGTFGSAATFSFYPGKNLGAMGDAGCLVTGDDELARWSALYARHGGKGDHEIEGINSRLDGLQAAILSAKLPHLRQWTKERRRVAGLYDKLLRNIPQVQTPRTAAKRTHVYHLYVICADRRDGLREYLERNGIATVLNYPKALPFYPAYDYLGHKPEDFPVAHANQSRILSLPIFPEMSEEQVSYVAEKIGEFYSKSAA